ncbi:uncharacterized protein [Periplaneta americana]
MKQLQMVDAATQMDDCSDSESIDLEFQRWFRLVQVEKQQHLTAFEGSGSFGWEAGHETTADGRCCHPDGRLQRFREQRLGIPKMVSLNAVQKQQELTAFEGSGSFGWEAGHEATADGRCCHPDEKVQRFREQRL